jgi:ornithine cyclodeaminase
MVNKYALLASLLRLSEEPTEYFNEIEINECLLENTNLFMDLLENFYIEWCTNSDLVLMPIKQLFSTEGTKGDFRVMPCVINEFNGHIIKAVKIIGTNEEEKVIKDKISVGKSLLLHPTDNFPIAIFDVCALSSFRTAAISILAYKYFIQLTKSSVSSNKEKVKIGIIGAGRIAFYTAIILHQWLGINEVEVFEINKKHTSSFLSSTSLCCDKLKVTCKSIDQLNSNHNAVFLCTNSSTPIISSLNAKNIAFISSVGADADNLSELHSSILEGREIYTDSKQSMFIGDLQKWSQLQLVDRKKIYELTDMIKKSLNKNHKKFDITKNKLFISTGVAIQDALISHFLYSRLQ